jgi:hypothetical protein
LKRIVYVRKSDSTRVAFGSQGVIAPGTTLDNVPPSLRHHFTEVEIEEADVAAPEPIPEPIAPAAESLEDAEESDDSAEESAAESLESAAESVEGTEDADDVTVVLPLVGYSDLSQRAILAQLPSLDAHELRVIRNFESRDKKRPRILDRIDTLLQGE